MNVAIYQKCWWLPATTTSLEQPHVENPHLNTLLPKTLQPRCHPKWQESNQVEKDEIEPPSTANSNPTGRSPHLQRRWREHGTQVEQLAVALPLSYFSCLFVINKDEIGVMLYVCWWGGGFCRRVNRWMGRRVWRRWRSELLIWRARIAGRFNAILENKGSGRDILLFWDCTRSFSSFGWLHLWSDQNQNNPGRLWYL